MRRPSARTARVAAVTVLAAASVAACSITSSSTPSSDTSNGGPSGTPITVGFTVSLTGSFQADGQAVLRGYQLWRDDVNAHDGLLGRPVKLVYLNDKSDQNVATADYTKLITQDHVDLTLGPFSSLLTIPAGRVAHKYGYALVEGSGGAPTVFGASLPNLFGVSAPVANQLEPFTKWVLSLPAGQRPRSAAYVMVDDPFADPPVEAAQATLAKAGITTVYDNSGQPGSTAKLLEPNSSGTVPTPVLTAAADKVIAANPQIVVIGSVDVPTVSGILNEFRAQHFNPKMIIATSGPDQGQDFLNAIGTGNADGIMVPDGWYGALPDPLSHVMVQEYIAKYGGTSSEINADVAEAYSSGEVLADAVSNVGVSNAKIIGFLHGLRQPLDTVQGPAQWGPYVAHRPSGMNTKAVSFVFQWQPVAQFVKVLPAGGDSVAIKATKPLWTTG
ncbi:MAG TPA: amino acid ABC transporter substrate-binding protein [Streptosporangiaceae bacterium]|nr:amino acid ABC transporter substrate-binding protein [Streptosporangiaceae bacterium]